MKEVKHDNSKLNDMLKHTSPSQVMSDFIPKGIIHESCLITEYLRALEDNMLADRYIEAHLESFYSTTFTPFQSSKIEQHVHISTVNNA